VRNGFQKTAAFAVPFLILIAMTIPPLMTLAFGKEIDLQMKAVDPTDAFRGDYVTVNLEAETVPSSRLDNQVIQKIKRHENEKHTVYAVLKKGKNGSYVVDKVVAKKPAYGLYLRGTIDMYWGSADNAAVIDYHLDRYFVPENSGKQLENASAQGKAQAVVKVWRGRAVLVNVKAE
jgi:uncharacterized membrane-anchored protein